MQTSVEQNLCIPRDETDAPCKVTRTIGCPLHRLSSTKRNNRTHEKSLYDPMSKYPSPGETRSRPAKGRVRHVQRGLTGFSRWRALVASADGPWVI